MEENKRMKPGMKKKEWSCREQHTSAGEKDVVE